MARFPRAACQRKKTLRWTVAIRSEEAISPPFLRSRRKAASSSVPMSVERLPHRELIGFGQPALGGDVADEHVDLGFHRTVCSMRRG
jgi:hypothetical protein